MGGSYRAVPLLPLAVRVPVLTPRPATPPPPSPATLANLAYLAAALIAESHLRGPPCRRLVLLKGSGVGRARPREAGASPGPWRWSRRPAHWVGAATPRTTAASCRAGGADELWGEWRAACRGGSRSPAIHGEGGGGGQHRSQLAAPPSSLRHTGPFFPSMVCSPSVPRPSIPGTDLAATQLARPHSGGPPRRRPRPL